MTGPVDFTGQPNGPHVTRSAAVGITIYQHSLNVGVAGVAEFHGVRGSELGRGQYGNHTSSAIIRDR